MGMTAERGNQLAAEISDRLAGIQLRREEARLYSQHSRLRNRQPGLSSWSPNEASDRLSEAISLIHAGTALRENNDERWRSCFVRCGELLEWLSHPAMALNDVPSQLLSAAAYDIAGYPARADALLREMGNAQHSRILRSFLRGDLVDALEGIRLFWQREAGGISAESRQASSLSNLIVTEVVRALGVICSSLRWASEVRLPQALDKLRNASVFHASDRDSLSWLLAKLTSEASRELSLHSWRTVLAPLVEQVSEGGRIAFDRYCRLAYAQARSRAWPSQEEGIRLLLAGGSFALCTPTGSGKTNVAEIALLDAIVGRNSLDVQSSPLALYLVPSRALAAEVEGKLTRVLRRTSTRRIVVTGLYGGTDWGPTDAWLTTDEPTVVICTYEKAEALLRFIGPLMLPRLTLVIFDEAHAVQFNGDMNSLRQGENRSLRLESLGLRISQLIDREKCKLIALSAVAVGLEDSLHQWVSGSNDGRAARVTYRSTRQLIGRMVVAPSGSYSIYYDILDGKALRFSRDAEATPYVPNALPASPRPPSGWTGPEKMLRPALLWAALHLSAPDDLGRRHAVLISITQRIAGYAKDFLQLLEQHWSDLEFPSALGVLTIEQQDELQKTLALCEDYFGTESYEYRLLRRGIVIHHSSMPKSLSRRVIELIHSHTVSIVLATSTLSEGVNIPVETILVPSLYRGTGRLPASEFRNLAGRAGRPGVATEGRTLIILPPASKSSPDRANRGYSELLNEILQVRQQIPRSPLAEAINDIWSQWQLRNGASDFGQFLNWLEQVNFQHLPQTSRAEFASLDSLDSVLLAGIVENEELPSGIDWENRLQGLWNSSFASHLASDQNRLAFLRRGTAIPVVYPDRGSRRRFYRTGLPPSTAFELFQVYAEIKAVLTTGRSYAEWAPDRRFQYVVDVVKAIGRMTRFKLQEEEADWTKILKWWIWRGSSPFPAPNKLADWHRMIGTTFSYRCSWGLGSVLGFAFEQVSDGHLQATSLDTWESTALPWIAFWLKELLAWGTLDPAAAFLLARGEALTRTEAERVAMSYYDSDFATSRSDPIDPRSIRDWVRVTFPQSARQSGEISARAISARVTDISIAHSNTHYRVLPLFGHSGVRWVDVAGYVLAESPSKFRSIIERMNFALCDFILKPADRVVAAEEYV
jgi:hypothetical protein